MFLSAVYLLLLSQDTGGKSASSIRGLHAVSYDVLSCSAVRVSVFLCPCGYTSSANFLALMGVFERERECETDVQDEEAVMFFFFKKNFPVKYKVL